MNSEKLFSSQYVLTNLIKSLYKNRNMHLINTYCCKTEPFNCMDYLDMINYRSQDINRVLMKNPSNKYT